MGASQPCSYAQLSQLCPGCRGPGWRSILQATRGTDLQVQLPSLTCFTPINATAGVTFTKDNTTCQVDRS